MEILQDYTIERLKNLIVELGEKPYRATQVYRAMHQGRAISEMTDLSKDFREKLLERFVDNPAKIIKKRQSL